MKVRFIINPAAGPFRSRRAEKVTDAVRRRLGGVEGVFDIKVAGGKESAGSLSKEAVDKGYEVVFACGGDGTVNEVASPLVGRATALGVIPGGSGNGFAMSLGIPRDLDQAVGLVKEGRVREIDTGVICGRYFFSTAGCGFDAHLSRRYNEGAFSGKLRGLVPYFPIAMVEFFRYRAEPVVIRTSLATIKAAPFLLTAANTERYGGGAIIAPGAVPDDGLLDVCIISDAGALNAPSIAARLFSGRIDRFKGFERVRTDTVEISGRDSTVLHADGEPFEWTGDVSISVLPKSLKVLVPA